jgi:O-antigen/teichoic acid export membrane protein
VVMEPLHNAAHPDGDEIYSRQAVSSQRSPNAIVASVYRRHRDLLRNTGSLYATVGVTSIMGAVYWALAARLFSQQDVGYGAAEVPAMTLLGTIGVFGLDILLVSELPKCKRRAEFVSAALIACALGSLLLSIGFAFIAPHFSQQFATMLGTLDQKGLFVVGATLTSAGMATDMATIGVLRGGIQLTRNMTFSLFKLAAMPIFAFVLHGRLGLDITFSWVAGIALSLVLVAARMAHSGTRLLVRPDWGFLRSLRRAAMAYNWINIAVTAPPTMFPILVALLISPSTNAVFYIAFTLSAILYLIPTHLSTVLLAMAAAEPHTIAHKVRFALKFSYLIGLPAMAVLILSSHRILSFYGPEYARIGTLPMCLFTLGYIPSVFKVLYMAICRANGRMAYCAVILTLFTLAEIGGVAAGAASDGLVGLSIALLAVLTAQGAVVTPLLLRAVIVPQTSSHLDHQNSISGSNA